MQNETEVNQLANKYTQLRIDVASKSNIGPSLAKGRKSEPEPDPFTVTHENRNGSRTTVHFNTCC